MKISGKKMGSVKALKESLKKGGSSLSTYIKNVPSEGITVRFLTEPEEWFGYYEYYNAESKNYCPMAQGEVLPDGAKPSFRYLACAVDVESDRVIPLKLAKTAANSLILKYDKFGTIIDRNYELQRHGEGLDTTYDVTPDAPSKLHLSKYEVLDLEKVLIDARSNALGETDTEASKATPKMDDDDIDDDDEESEEDSGDLYDELFPNDEFREDYSEAELNTMFNKYPDEFASLLEDWGIDALDDKPRMEDVRDAVKAVLFAQKETEETEDETDEDEEADTYDEEALGAMAIRDLRTIAEELDIDFKSLSKDELIEAIIEASEK